MRFFLRFSNNLSFWVFLVHPETTLPDGLEISGQWAYHKFWHISRSFWVFVFWMIFSVFKKNGFLGILGPPYCGFGATICIGREMLCLPYAGFLINCIRDRNKEIQLFYHAYSDWYRFKWMELFQSHNPC